MPEGERTRNRRLPGDERGVEIARRDGDRPNEHVGGLLHPRVRDLPPLQRPGPDERQLLHPARYVHRRDQHCGRAEHRSVPGSSARPGETRSKTRAAPEGLRAGARTDKRGESDTVTGTAAGVREVPRAKERYSASSVERGSVIAR